MNVSVSAIAGRMLVLLCVAAAGAGFAAYYLQFADYYWVQQHLIHHPGRLGGEILFLGPFALFVMALYGVALLLGGVLFLVANWTFVACVIALIAVRTAIGPRKYVWALMLPFVFAAASYVTLAWAYSVPVSSKDALVHIASGEVRRPITWQGAESGSMLTGHGRYRIVSGVQGRVRQDDVSGRYTFSDEALRMWTKDTPIAQAAEEAFAGAVTYAKTEKRAVRIALVAHEARGLRDKFCEAAKSIVKTTQCPFASLYVGVERNDYDSLWNDRYSAREAIDDKVAKAAVKLLTGQSIRDDAIRNDLISVVLSDKEGTAQHAYEILKKVPRLRDEEQAKLWDAVYARTDAACILLTALTEMVGLTDAERARMRDAAKATTNGNCAAILLRDAKRKEIGIVLSDTERDSLRLIVAQGKNAALVEELLADGKTLDVIEHEVWVDSLVRGKIFDMSLALKPSNYHVGKLSPEGRARVILRIAEMRNSDFQDEWYQTPVRFLEKSAGLTESERQIISAALKQKMKSEPELAVGIAVRTQEHNIDAETLGDLYTVFSQIPAMYAAEVLHGLRSYHPDKDTVRTTLYDAVIAGHDKKACARAIEAPTRGRYSDRSYTISPDRLKALKVCA